MGVAVGEYDLTLVGEGVVVARPLSHKFDANLVKTEDTGIFCLFSLVEGVVLAKNLCSKKIL